MKSPAAVLAVLVLIAAMSGPLSAQKLTPEEHSCVLNYVSKGAAASAPDPLGCSLGFIPIVIEDLGVPKVIKGGTVLASFIPLGSCGIIKFYPGSFRPPTEPDPLKPPTYAVTDFCSPTGLAHAYYNGLHEGYHKSCP